MRIKTQFLCSNLNIITYISASIGYNLICLKIFHRLSINVQNHNEEVAGCIVQCIPQQEQNYREETRDTRTLGVLGMLKFEQAK